VPQFGSLAVESTLDHEPVQRRIAADDEPEGGEPGTGSAIDR
jgi:hypothetical protein